MTSLLFVEDVSQAQYEDRVSSSFKKPQLIMAVGDSYGARLRLRSSHGAGLYCLDTLSFEIRSLRAASIAILSEIAQGLALSSRRLVP